MNASEVVTAIARGTLDVELTAISEAIRGRTRYLDSVKAEVNQLQLKPGTKVRILPGLKPKYTAGLTGKIADAPSTRAGDLMFEFDDRSFEVVRHRFRRVVGIPASLLTKVER